MQTQLNSRRAFTKIELLVVISIIGIITAILLPSLALQKQRSRRIDCINHLKLIGTSYRIWNSTQSDAYPTMEPAERGGWLELLNGPSAVEYYFTNYVLMQNELGQSTGILTCPSDERQPAKDFKTLRNTNISYFLGADAHETFPQSILGGDRNLAPGLVPKNDYGFSPSSGQGADLWIKTNAAIDPVCWSLKMHSHGNSNGAGNILLGDGSVQQVSSAVFRNEYQTNGACWGIRHGSEEQRQISFRLIFP